MINIKRYMNHLNVIKMKRVIGKTLVVASKLWQISSQQGCDPSIANDCWGRGEEIRFRFLSVQEQSIKAPINLLNQPIAERPSIPAFTR